MVSPMSGFGWGFTFGPGFFEPIAVGGTGRRDCTRSDTRVWVGMPRLSRLISVTTAALVGLVRTFFEIAFPFFFATYCCLPR